MASFLSANAYKMDWLESLGPLQRSYHILELHVSSLNLIFYNNFVIICYVLLTRLHTNFQT